MSWFVTVDENAWVQILRRSQLRICPSNDVEAWLGENGRLRTDAEAGGIVAEAEAVDTGLICGVSDRLVLAWGTPLLRYGHSTVCHLTAKEMVVAIV